MEPAVATARLTSSPLLREACFEDYQEIASLQSRNCLSARSYADWSRLWMENPAYTARRSQPIGWVLENANGAIGGYLGNLPLDYQLGARTIRAATPYSWVVEPACRCSSVALLQQFLRQPGVDLFVCTTPNGTAGSVLRALRFSRAPAGTWDQAGFWITGYQGFARSVLRAAPVRLSALLAYPLGAALCLTDSLRGDPGMRAADDAFELCHGFDSRFDDFWNELKSQNATRLLAVRTRKTLEWHFGAGLKRNTVWILAAVRNSRLAAYAIIDRQDNPALGLKRFRIADFQPLHGYEGLLRPALAWVLRHCRNERVHMVENVGCWLDRFHVPGTGARYHRKLQSWLFYYLTADPVLREQLRDPEIWMPSSYDGDSSI